MTAQNGKEGLLVALETRPDLLILDINLPDMTGLQLLQRLRGHAETRDIKRSPLAPIRCRKTWAKAFRPVLRRT